MLLALFYVTIRKEYEKDNKIYAATILGALFVVGMFILSISNIFTSDKYSSSHLLSVISTCGD